MNIIRMMNDDENDEEANRQIEELTLCAYHE